MAKTEKHIFISHQHEDAEKIQQVIDLIEKNGKLDIKDSSIYQAKNENNATSPEYIKSGIIAPAIEWASTVIVLIGKETKKSDWVNWEIEYAGKKDKKIIGVFLPGSDDSDIPDAFKVDGMALCKWNSNSIGNALKGETACETPDGTPRTNPIGYKLITYSCPRSKK